MTNEKRLLMLAMFTLGGVWAYSSRLINGVDYPENDCFFLFGAFVCTVVATPFIYKIVNDNEIPMIKLYRRHRIAVLCACLGALCTEFVLFAATKKCSLLNIGGETMLAIMAFNTDDEVPV